MTSAILNVTFDCSDSFAIARFWAAVTGWEMRQQNSGPAHEEFSVGPAPGGDIRLYFVSVREQKIVKNRLHLDVVPRDRSQAQEVARLVGLGASVAADQPAGVGWVILADPDGNEFCVEGGR
jgi:catechol 2,3-dioxygenase-like lactoylglutathione lyase family enzyme